MENIIEHIGNELSKLKTKREQLDLINSLKIKLEEIRMLIRSYNYVLGKWYLKWYQKVKQPSIHEYCIHSRIILTI